MNPQNTSTSNEQFWDELCGSQAAKSLGVTDSSQESLKRFDDWYFYFYPYLFTHIPFSTLENKDVLEIGLGYGTVSQRLAESGANFQGLDIAAGPVSMVNRRLNQIKRPGRAIQGSILDPPFEPGSFDTIIAIGCLHHTGDLQTALDRCRSLLKPGGELIFMVYYAYSYRRWYLDKKVTSQYLRKELFGYRGVVGISSDEQRSAYDTSSKGEGAPHTDWISKRSLKKLCRKFSTFTSKLENIDQEPPFQKTPREDLLKTRWSSFAGLDLYASAKKPNN